MIRDPQAVEPSYQRIASIRVVDEVGVYFDVDCFSEVLSADRPKPVGDTARYALRVNRQAAKQIDDSTYEIIATGKRLRRVSAQMPAQISAQTPVNKPGEPR